MLLSTLTPIMRKASMLYKLRYQYIRANLYSVKKLTFLKSHPFSTNILDVNTNVTKDVTLYKFDNERKIKMLNLFGLGQFIFWNYLAQTIYTTLKDVPVEKSSEEDKPWYMNFNLGGNAIKYSLTGFCIIVGNGFAFAAVMYTLRCIKLIVLRKGGRTISLATYTPLGGESVMNVPVNKVSASANRANARVTIPLKVQGKSFYYSIDMDGNFGNVSLFDATVGLKRHLRNA